MKLLIVAQSPSQNMPPEARPLEATQSLRHLAELSSYVPSCCNILYDMADFVNIIEYWPGKHHDGGKYDEYPKDIAAIRAKQIWIDVMREGYTHVITLGKAVNVSMREAVQIESVGWYNWQAVPLMSADFEQPLLAASPHPGRTNRYWNDPINTIKATSFWTSTFHAAAREEQLAGSQ